MNRFISSFSRRHLNGKLFSHNLLKSWTYSPNNHLRCSSTLSLKYAVFEPKQKTQFIDDTKTPKKKEMDHSNPSLTVQNLILRDAQTPTSDAAQAISRWKQRLEDLNENFEKTLTEIEQTNKTMENTEHFGDMADLDAVESISFLKDFKTSLIVKPSPLLGTEDRDVPTSEEPCVGCGATLQCQHRTFPGFLPSEYFKVLTAEEMKSTLCQRCYYIQNCDAFQEVSTNPKEFSQLISNIKSTRSIVVLVVDVMDIQGSIIPNLMDYIGKNHPVIIVGNKADLLCPDSTDYLKNVSTALKNQCYRAGIRNMKKCVLISAKTGFGIERLITTLFTFYKQKVDIYIVGSANAGKSSLFNTLLASDYCKHTARDLIQRATISPWPGTTLNLLKFPIMRPSSRTSTLRVLRLKQKQAQKLLEKQEKILKLKRKENDLTWELKEEVEVTDVRTAGQFQADEVGTSWGQEIGGYIQKGSGMIEINKGPEKSAPFNSKDYHESYWTYDTPGLVNPTQVMNLLTSEEAPFIAPKTMLVPQCVLLNPGDSLFVSGLARLDYLESRSEYGSSHGNEKNAWALAVVGMMSPHISSPPLIAADISKGMAVSIQFGGNDTVVFTVHCGPQLPIVVMPTLEADQFYIDSVGTEKLGLPLGSKERILRLPSLCGKEFTVKGMKPNIASSDIQMSSIGWISVAPQVDQEVKLRAYTPGGVGMHQRNPALLPNYTVYRGKRISGTPFLATKPPGWIMANEVGELLES